jgi:hypothetical protein
MKQHHQSKNTKGLKPRPKLLDSADRPQIDVALRRENRSLGTDELLERLRLRAPQFYNLAEVVGSWVWISFDEKQPAEVTAALSQFGFHWNNLRQAWQHPCGTAEPDSKFDPRKRFGSHFAADQKAA